MPTAKCKDCGEPFNRSSSESWKTLCLDCFKERKRDESSLVARLRQDLYDRGRYIDHLLDVIDKLEMELETTRQQPTFTEWLPRLVQLCHPDKHNGSRLSVQTTQWLNSIRNVTGFGNL